MARQVHDPLSEALVERFKRAAIVAHCGHEDEDLAMQSAGIAAARRAVETLDALRSDGRQALVPLLDDPDWGVRAYAAGYLLERMPARALTVLKDIDARCPTSASMTAYRMLRAFELDKPV